MQQSNNALKAQLASLPSDRRERYLHAMEELVGVVQRLSHARDVGAISAIVREAARNLTGADGATFVLREGDKCYYADENAISPLWKGLRFPMNACISGWVMEHAQPAVIEDIYKDERIPIQAYKPTFVKSLAMVPIRRNSPIGAIGNYWASHYKPTDEEMQILQALADTTSVALENASLYSDLQAKLKELQESNYELGRFAWVASHDLREPLRTIVTHVQMLEERIKDKLDERSSAYCRTIVERADRLQQLIEDLLMHAQMQRSEKFRPVSLQKIYEDVCADMAWTLSGHTITVASGELPWVYGDASMISRLLQNLISNAIKFRKADVPLVISLSATPRGREWLISVSDNGIGIEEAYQQSIFNLFQRLYSQDEYPGSGIGLATCKKVIELHQGTIWVESQPGAGSVFHFTLPNVDASYDTEQTV